MVYSTKLILVIKHLVLIVSLLTVNLINATDFSIVDDSKDNGFYNFLFEKITSEAQYISSTTKVSPLLLRVINKQKETIGGIAAYIFYGSLLIDILWVDKQYRRKGIGRALINEAESVAKKYNLNMISVSTMGFWNALGFYQKLDFEIEFIKKGFNGNICQYFLVKKIKNENR